jgi:hypothetical protein
MVNHLDAPVGFSSPGFFHEEVGITMTHRIAVRATLGIMLLAGSVIAADALKSGPQVGDGCVPFNPENITGAFAGQKQCLV